MELLKNNMMLPPPPPHVINRDCAVCGSKRQKMLFRQQFAKIEGVSFLDGYEVVSCGQCGFVYASNIPSQAAFDNYYINANKYEHEIEQPDCITGKYEHIVREIIHLHDDKTVSVVDVGCARSEILRSLRNNGFSNLTGIDPSLKNIEYLKSKGIKGIHGTIDMIDASEQYDVVLFLMVLEHIVDLKKTLITLYNLAADNGMVIVSVPDMTCLKSNELPYQEFSREHINYFTPVSLSNLMLRHGFYTMFYKSSADGTVGFFKKIANKIQKDSAGAQHICRYIERSKQYEEEIYANLLPYSNVPVIIWGLGTFTQRLLTKNVLKNIIALVDSNPAYTGRNYKGIGIIPPAGLKNRQEPIVPAVSFRYTDAVIHTIREELRLDNEIIKIHHDYAFDYNFGDIL